MTDSNRVQRHGDIEVRLHKDGGFVDEIVVDGMFHLEQMDNGVFWAKITGKDGQDLIVRLYATKGGRICCRHEWDPEAMPATSKKVKRRVKRGAT